MLLIISLLYAYPLSAAIVFTVKMMIMYDRRMYDIYKIGTKCEGHCEKNEFHEEHIASVDFSGLKSMDRKYFVIV